MKRTRTVMATMASALALAGGCGDDGGSWTVPDRLYVALDGSELAIRLVELEPAPY